MKRRPPYPRSPYEKLGGFVHLPRLIDKAKLHRQGLLDGYNYKTVGFDKHLLAFLKIDGDVFDALADSAGVVVGLALWEVLRWGRQGRRGP